MRRSVGVARVRFSKALMFGAGILQRSAYWVDPTTADRRAAERIKKLAPDIYTLSPHPLSKQQEEILERLRESTPVASHT